MGICSAVDDFNQRMATIFDDLPDCRRVVESFVIFSRTIAEHQVAVRRIFTHAVKHYVSFNAVKTQLAKPSVAFGGYIIDGSGFRSDPTLTDAIKDFPFPTNITDIRSFFGLCQQMGSFSDNVSRHLKGYVTTFLPLQTQGIIVFIPC